MPAIQATATTSAAPCARIAPTEERQEDGGASSFPSFFFFFSFPLFPFLFPFPPSPSSGSSRERR